MRFYRAWVYGGNWHMQTTLKSEPEWQLLDPIPRDVLQALRDKLWEKYQRNRVPFKHIEQVDALLEDATD
jgi:hypothetical protein